MSKSVVLALGALALGALAASFLISRGADGFGSGEPIEKQRVILDTDVGADIDDAGALAVLHALADRGEIDILAIGVVNGHEAAVPYTDAVNTWYGRPDLPVGTIRSGAPFSTDLYLKDVVETYPHDLTQRSAPDVVALYRKTLAAEADRSVTLIAIGPATNISALLESGPDEHSPLSGVDLVARKVKFYAAGGNGSGKLPRGRPGFNYLKDLAAARNELAKLPATFPTVFAGGSGEKIQLGTLYRKADENHVVRKSFEAYFPGQEKMDRPIWDELRVLYGCRPAARKFFQTSAPGDITWGENDEMQWSDAASRNRAYAYVKRLRPVKAQLTELMLHVPGETRAAER